MDGGGHDGSSLALPYLMFIYVALLIIGAMSLKAVKFLFEFVTHRQVFNFAKLFTYGCFSQLI
jgi:hypothetical protein